ncbi:ABC transporter substrate-binding protein [Oricola cellulosilytica]|nr:ABC transporter substrate-binding protein [Oricola cellulosilytica]
MDETGATAMTARIAGRLSVCALLLAAAPAPAQESATPVIGIAGPLSGYFTVLGEQIEAGVKAAVAKRDDIKTRTSDDGCSAEGGERSARDLADARVAVVVGYPCIEAFDAAMPILAEAGIPVMAVGIQAEGITQDSAPDAARILRFGPKSSDEAEALADYLKERWRAVNFAIIDDGTLYGRQFAEAVRFLLEEDNLQPVFTDNYRPQLENQMGLVRRLQRSGATHVLIGGDAYDAAVIADNAATIDVPLTLAGGSALVAAPENGRLVDGTIVAAQPDYAVREPAAELRRRTEGSGIPQIGYIAPAYAATEVALFGLDIGAFESPASFGPMLSRTFRTALGPLSFDANGDPESNLFEVFVVDDGRLVPDQNGGSQERIQ